MSVDHSNGSASNIQFDGLVQAAMEAAKAVLADPLDEVDLFQLHLALRVLSDCGAATVSSCREWLIERAQRAEATDNFWVEIPIAGLFMRFGLDEDRFAKRLLALLDHPDVFAAHESAEVLSRYPKHLAAGIPRLGEIVADTSADEALRIGIAEILGKAGEIAVPALPSLLAAMSHEGWGIGAAAKRAIEQIGLLKLSPAQRKAFDGVLPRRSKRAPKPQGLLGTLKSWFGKDQPSAIPEIGEILGEVRGNKYWNADYDSLEAELMDLGPAVIPQLVRALDDEDEHVRALAAGTLARFSPEHGEEAIPALLPLLADQYMPPIEKARLALTRFATKAVPHLLNAARSSPLLLRLRALETLHLIRNGT